MDISNILKNIYHIKNNNLKELYSSSKRINKMGDALETYIKDACCSTYELEEKEEKKKAYSEVFSFQGTSSRPPDFMIRSGDAFEVKKLESEHADIQLNSSFPKRILKKSDPKLSKACRECEEWKQKDMWYSVGYVKENQIKRLWFIDGSCIAADESVYEAYFERLSQTISQEFGQAAAATKELGRLNRIDPMGLTHMRIRPMWILKNPSHLFGHLVPPIGGERFSCVAVMRKEKWTGSRLVEGINVWEGKLLDPSNIEKEIDVIITYFAY